MRYFLALSLVFLLVPGAVAQQCSASDVDNSSFLMRLCENFTPAAVCIVKRDAFSSCFSGVVARYNNGLEVFLKLRDNAVGSSIPLQALMHDSALFLVLAWAIGHLACWLRSAFGWFGPNH